MQFYAEIFLIVFSFHYMSQKSFFETSYKLILEYELLHLQVDFGIQSTALFFGCVNLMFFLHVFISHFRFSIVQNCIISHFPNERRRMNKSTKEYV